VLADLIPTGTALVSKALATIVGWILRFKSACTHVDDAESAGAV